MWLCRSAAPTLNTLIQTPGRRGPIVLMSVRLPLTPSHSEPFAPYVLSSTRSWTYLKWPSAHRSVGLTLNTLIPILERHMFTALRNARQLKLRTSKHNTYNHNKVPCRILYATFHSTHRSFSNSGVQLSWLYTPRHTLSRRF